MSTILLRGAPVASLDEYTALGGGAGLAKARELGPDGVIAVLRDSGLRGRGGAGFPTAIKWSGIRSAGRPAFVACNAAEGEPGTFKDRWLMRNNPYQLVEGLVIAAETVQAPQVFVGIKELFLQEMAALERAIDEMRSAGMIGDLMITLVPGPDDYLFGEEKGLLEVIEGRDPLPRMHPPYIQGLFETTIDEPSPVLVNNVETLSNVPHALANGAEWFRGFGTDDTPGTGVFTIGGDVEREIVVEMPMGTPFSTLLDAAGGVKEGRGLLMVVNGVSNRPLTAAEAVTPLDHGSMRALGTGLGSGGFTVYDETACVAGVAEAMTAFLMNGSCGQCLPCKMGATEIRARFDELREGIDGPGAVEDLGSWVLHVTDQNRCGLGSGTSAFTAGILSHFAEYLAVHVAGGSCGTHREYAAPVIKDWDPAAGRFTYRAVALK
ncbi:MAG: hypothetical protein KQH83_06310 [Actinobacteria bacterium]|nr:hypothetical protein [Actinomycetota bacterium]